MHRINYIQTNIQHICNIGHWYSEKTKERRTTGRKPQGICYWGYLILGVIGKPFLWHDFLKNWELEELFTSLKLFPFMFRGDVNVTSYDETGALDTVIEMGIYKVKPKQGVWGTLVVFNAFDGAGGVVQKLYNATGAKYRVKNSNTDNLWTDWKSF